MKYRAILIRKIDVEIEAEHIQAAEAIANKIAGEFPVDTCLVDAIYPADYKEPPPAPAKAA